MICHTKHSWDTPECEENGLQRPNLLVVLAVVGLVGALLVLIAFVHPSLGAAGGCGGG